MAAAYKGRYLIVFGGGSVAHCFNDLHVLDTETMEWSQPPVEGDQPSARAGESRHSVQLPTPAAHIHLSLYEMHLVFWYQSVSIGPQPTTLPMQASGQGSWPQHVQVLACAFA